MTHPAYTAVFPPGWRAISQPEATRRGVVLAGRVRDAVTQAPIAGAVVTLGDDTAGTVSRADGLFWFVGPVGDTPTGILRVHAPQLGTRYGTVEQSVSLVSALPLSTLWEIALPPTRLGGIVTNPQGAPIGAAQVRLCGDAQTVLTDAQGAYILMPLVASQPTVEASAPQYVSQRTALPAPLRAGEATTIDMTLTPARAS